MSASVKTLRRAALMLALGFVATPVTAPSGPRCSLSAQGTHASPPASPRPWPRWEGAPTPAEGAVAVPDALPPASDQVLARSVLGAAAGWSLGSATHSGITALVTFSTIQGLLTANAIR